MKLNRRQTRRLIESILNERPQMRGSAMDAFDDLDSSSDDAGDNSNYPANKSEATASYAKRINKEAEELEAKMIADGKPRSKASFASLDHMTKFGVSTDQAGNSIIKCKDGSVVKVLKSDVERASLNESAQLRKIRSVVRSELRKLRLI